MYIRARKLLDNEFNLPTTKSIDFFGKTGPPSLR